MAKQKRVQKEKRLRRNFDLPWKRVLELYLKPTLQLINPKLYDDVDWSKKVYDLEKELISLLRKRKSKKIVADKIFEVTLKTGEKCRIILHFEIQSQKLAGFERRMFEYFSKLRGKSEYVVSFALLTDADPNWRPNRYSQERYGTKLDFEFNSIKMLDLLERCEALRKEGHPLGYILPAHFTALQSKESDEARKLSRLELTAELIRLEFDAETIEELYQILDCLLPLSKVLETFFLRELRTKVGETPMKLITRMEQRAEKKGKAKGKIEGKVEGKVEGKIEGKVEGILKVIPMLLEIQFGQAGEEFAKELQDIQEIEVLDAVLQGIKEKQSIDELRQLIPQK